jgi:pimeloyl-ACP methyl ester carboxylesterase
MSLDMLWCRPIPAAALSYFCGIGYRQQMTERPLKLILTVTAALILTACAAGPKTDLKRLYTRQADNPNQPPVVIIPGALGSRLVDSVTGNEHWPGSLGKIVFSDYRTLRLDINPQTLAPLPPKLVAGEVAASVGGVDFYGRLLSMLEDIAGYKPSIPGTPVVDGKKRYYVFRYDWRLDNVDTVRELDKFIARIREDYGQPNLKVDVVAHSMGGMIIRYFVRYGTADVLDGDEFPVSQQGAARIRRVILLGTPNLGSTGALRTLIQGYKIGLGALPPEVVATFPSTYQVLPHAIIDWFVAMDGRPLKRDQFSVDNFWQRFGFSVFSDDVKESIRRRFEDELEAESYLALLQRYFRKHIERARRFSWSLSVPVPNPQVRYIVFGGDCLPTIARSVVEQIDGGWELRLAPGEIANPLPGIDYDQLMLEPGDGSVTKASLLARQTTDPTVARHKFSFFPLDYPVFLCETHSQLTGNIDFQNNLLHALLSADR